MGSAPISAANSTIDVAPVQPAPHHLNYVPPSPRPAGPTTPLTLTQHKHLLSSIRSLKKNNNSTAFLEPVDPVKFNIPTYPQVIDKPMDLGTVETKLIVSDPRGPPKDKSKMSKWDESKGRYNSVSEAVMDVRQIWENTRKFNGRDHVVSLAADKCEESFEKMLNNMPPEPVIAPPPVPAPAAGPSHPRRPSVSQPPVIRRTSEGADSRPKREIHPPPPKDLNYADGARRPKRRNDPQLQWALKTIKGFETSNKTFDAVAPFLYPVEQLISEIPDYATVIKKPIDLNQIKQKLAEGDYDDVALVNTDMKLMAANAMKYNPPGHAVHTAAQQLLQIWEEKWRQVPPKQETRESTEDAVVEEASDVDESDEEEIRALEEQIAGLQARIAALKSKKGKRRGSKAAKPKPKAPKPGPSQPRKQSMVKRSPGVNGNGHAKKARKSKEATFDEDESEPERELTMTQKQQLADRIGTVDETTMQQVMDIIQKSTAIQKGDNAEIEVGIEDLPPHAVVELYDLVVGGRKTGRPRGSGSAPVPKKRRPATGGLARKSMNEEEEADRIRRMEAQLQSFNAPGQRAGYGEDSDSSEEESSEEE